MKNLKIKILSIVLVLLLCLAGCTAANNGKADDSSQITVALFPYLPDVEFYQDIIESRWHDVEPDVKLSFVSWNCYEDKDPSGIDVIMYDALFESYLEEGGYIQPIKRSDIDEADDMVDFAFDDTLCEGTVVGIPTLLCSLFLFYYSDDAELADITDLDELYDALQDSSEGLVMNSTDSYPYMYLDALMDSNGTYTDYKNISGIKKLTVTAADDEATKAVILFDRLNDMGAVIPDDNDNAFSTA